jgi:hypothetical protein|tara:strand:- start:2678 stop:2941 length:264 start_codon:yes stop_codon:yes gene_type:complete
MKVTIQSENIVSLSPSECQRVALSYFYEKFNWKPEYYIEKGNIVIDKIYCGSHAFIIKEPVRAASDEDHLTNDFFKLITKKIEEDGK